ncbi:hypothetical protein [Mycobacteroides abscessus]|uniref:Uncharacterized protein n=1 Tax=Mycobacteroides abscessus subsp. bolletii 1513 TaxID=1299321 RepID=X8DSZ1_9MYCO|nr:hypothetical protein [Mycobacteroides abscessus]EUA70635.1 hypothetical protein I540_2159 [Mycobacteroides abscessus subsp. bolletii 1513]AMU30923.1 hypothetical protein A3N97_10285 [Mycobacteroides abscessus]EIU14607.1 hypothetical protein MA5S0304_1064 [Mycobacteroides abscessus 5S-0304]EIU15630.1 hypothetical protein MA5S0421_1345 [Mycobacteroides abscessus 5S-0421]EIU16283.1 hypothetical protein MA5S0422_2081 [Mycobacteroides abscessus 5S-0422]
MRDALGHGTLTDRCRIFGTPIGHCDKCPVLGEKSGQWPSPIPLAAPVISTADPVIGLPDTLIGARD